MTTTLPALTLPSLSPPHVSSPFFNSSARPATTMGLASSRSVLLYSMLVHLDPGNTEHVPVHLIALWIAQFEDDAVQRQDRK